MPLVFLALGDVRVWAQIDTGYEDFVHSHSVDINQALFDRLIESGARLDRVEDMDIWTCDGREHRPGYRLRTVRSELKTSRGSKSPKPKTST